MRAGHLPHFLRFFGPTVIFDESFSAVANYYAELVVEPWLTTLTFS